MLGNTCSIPAPFSVCDGGLVPVFLNVGMVNNFYLKIWPQLFFDHLEEPFEQLF